METKNGNALVEIKLFAREILLPAVEMMKQNEGYEDKKVIGFFAGKGKHYDKSPVKLMVIGRALYGWEDKHDASIITSLESAEEISVKAYNFIYKEDLCPLQWVVEEVGDDKKYNSNRSAFWRVIKRMVFELGCAPKDDPEWSSKIVWSDLYKINIDNGNPSEELCDAQYPGCAAMLELEIEKYQPDKILFLTGMGWAYPFIIDLKGFDCKTDQKTYVKGLGYYRYPNKEAQVVISVHPQGKNESELIQEIMEAFRSL